jgi:hypothetical protein
MAIKRKSVGKKQLGRPRFRWDVNIEIYVKGSSWKNADWNHMAQFRGQ